jgi:hypothetical protein
MLRRLLSCRVRAVYSSVNVPKFQRILLPYNSGIHGGRKVPLNIGTFIPDYTASHPKSHRCDSLRSHQLMFL